METDRLDKRISVRLSAELVKQLDQAVKATGYHDRSASLRALVAGGLALHAGLSEQVEKILARLARPSLSKMLRMQGRLLDRILGEQELQAAIIIWHFCDAPESYRKLSRHGGGEEWIGFVPKGMVPPWEHAETPWWLNALGADQTVNNMETYEVEGGTVYISAPA